LKTLLIEGWRGVNHSFALVNQNQILALAGMPDVRLLHRDLPFAMSHWNASDNADGFAGPARALLDGLRPPAPGERVDAVYRICSPFRAGDTGGVRTVQFMVSEMGLRDGQFASSSDRAAMMASEDPVVTPSAWSWQRLVEDGMAAGRVRVVAHGVDAARFRPMEAAARATVRRQFGIEDDEVLFLNVGAPLWHKGTDLLLRAFAVLRLDGLKVRLFFKDQRALYGRTIGGVLQELGRDDASLRDERVVSAVAAIPGNFAPEGLAAMFGMADCYVSPYRAEGFNLPVLEAIACGLPAIVTAGGATDDFCDESVSVRVAGRLERKSNDEGMVVHIEPAFEALVEAMRAFAGGARLEAGGFEASRVRLLERFSWGRAAEGVVGAAFGRPGALPLDPAKGEPLEPVF
jgi:glycosyltransferase involved in cell wall biosynthesis